MTDLSNDATNPVPQALLDSTRAYAFIRQANAGLIRILQEASDLDPKISTTWTADAQKLVEFKPEPRRLVVIGRTGAGKSTAITALCGQPILATGADVYPQAPSTSHIQLENLLNDEAVRALLGAEIAIGPCRPAELEARLRHYVTSRVHVAGVPAHWHLVELVKVYGAFEALASGAVTLVDVPGYGDANKTRTERTQEYLRNADQIALVADIKRAVDDTTTREYLRTFIHRLIGIDGRKGSLMVLLTGSDNPISEKQVHRMTEKQRSVVQGWEAEEDELMAEQANLRAARAWLSGALENDQTDAKLKQNMKDDIFQICKREDEISKSLVALTSTKYSYVAQQRSSGVAEDLQQLYQSIYRSIAGPRNQKNKCTSLPIFCIGSTDFLRLSHLDNMQPMVFRDINDTGIPRLRQHIANTGHRQAFTEIKAHLTNARALLSEVQAFYKSCQKKDKRLAIYERFAANQFRGLQVQVNQVLRTTLGGIYDQVAELEKALREMALESAKTSLGIVTDLGETQKFNTYSAIMRRQGEWKDVDLNRDLSQDMFNADVAQLWNAVFNQFIGSQLRTLVSEIDQLFEKAIKAIVNRSKNLKTIRVQILSASELIDAHTSLDVARKEFAIGRSFGGTFGGILVQELLPHYESVSGQRGKGMFQRMKDINSQQFQPQNAQVLYNRTVDRVVQSIQTAIADGEQCFDDALKRLYISFNRSLVCVQGNSALEELRKQRRVPEMLAFINQCTAEGEAVAKIVDHHLDVNTIVVE
ncbi:hypothetical protein BV22DRAFT_1128553 [Leucogyrophana mollusca]|uniref:Uncharacterized protein n=1 Tax=Leucogyrophana mollusca TaxID=85980 RepID=A0ACB8BJC0_9AGAM|nr:hypothetical protein BV22DRAFT_1128553 [Leucogyrophana mollusca]